MECLISSQYLIVWRSDILIKKGLFVLEKILTFDIYRRYKNRYRNFPLIYKNINEEI